jgi:hypothetical protein
VRGRGGVKGLRPWNDFEKFTQLLADMGAGHSVEEKGRTRDEYDTLPQKVRMGACRSRRRRLSSTAPESTLVANI